MLPQSRQPPLDQWVSGDISEAKFRVIYQKHVNLPFRYYQEIFRFAREKAIPITAINAEIEIFSAVVKNGLGPVPEKLLEKTKFSSSAENKEYARLFGMPENRQYHNAGLPNLCDAQRLRDSVMAFHIAQLMSSNKNYSVIVLTGIAHAVKLAMPEMLDNFNELPYKVLLPDKISQIIPRTVNLDIADYLWYE